MSISLITHQDDKGGLPYNYITYLWRKILKVVSFTLMDVSTLTIKNNKKLSIFVLLLLKTHIWCTELQFLGHIYLSSGENLAHKSAESLRAAQLPQHSIVSRVNLCIAESLPMATPAAFARWAPGPVGDRAAQQDPDFPPIIIQPRCQVMRLRNPCFILFLFLFFSFFFYLRKSCFPLFFSVL